MDVPSWLVDPRLIIALGALVTIYQFLIRRPSLILEFYPISPESPVDHVQIPEKAHLIPVFYLRNLGHRHAENPYVEIELEEWNFDSSNVDVEPDGEVIDPEVENEDEEQTLEDRIFSPEARRGFTRDPKPEEKYSFPPVDSGPAMFLDNMQISKRDSKDAEEEYPVTELDVKSRDTVYMFGAPGEIRKLFFDNIIYKKSSSKLYFGTAELPTNRRFKISYTVACRGQKPKSGEIILEIFDDKVKVYSSHPSYYYMLESYGEEIIGTLNSIQWEISEFFHRIDRWAWKADRFERVNNPDEP